MGGGYKRNSARVLLAEVGREYGQAGVDTLIRELSLDEKLGLPVAQVIVS